MIFTDEVICSIKTVQLAEVKLILAVLFTNEWLH